MGYVLQVGEEEPKITSFEHRNHFGINKAKQKGESYIGFATNSGRVAGEDFQAMHDILTKYNAKGLALTASQNFVVYGVKDEDAQGLADEFDALGYPYKPSPFRARLNSCTGKEFCKFGITETKEFAKKVLVELENRFPNFDENITIAISGCGNGCSHPQISDIGFTGLKVRDDEGKRVEGYEVILGGNLEGEKLSRFAQKIGKKVEASKLLDYISDLIRAYKEDPKESTSFKDYLHKASLEA